ILANMKNHMAKKHFIASGEIPLFLFFFFGLPELGIQLVWWYYWVVIGYLLVSWGSDLRK
ncbi:MAG: hypothetical protein ABIH34_00975, partial [Nanoarchaeota archaeon]